MKIRTSFVSNSSSSSFVVAFKKKPKTDLELLSILFPLDKSNYRTGVVADWEDASVDALSAATIIWEQLKDQKELTKDEILEEIESGWFEGHPVYNNNYYYDNHTESTKISKEYTSLFKKNIHDKDADPNWKKRYNDAWKKECDEYDRLVNKAAKELMDRVYPAKFKGKKCFRFSFSDNDGTVFSTLEHGDTFRNVDHIRISHH